MTTSINQEKFTFKPWKQLIYIPDTNSEFDGKVVSNPHLSSGGRSFPKHFMSRCKTFSFLAWLAVNITAISRTCTSSLTVFYGSILSNPESYNKHHSIHPAYLSGIMWGSRKKKKKTDGNSLEEEEKETQFWKTLVTFHSHHALCRISCPLHACPIWTGNLSFPNSRLTAPVPRLSHLLLPHGACCQFSHPRSNSRITWGHKAYWQGLGVPCVFSGHWEVLGKERLQDHST